MSLMNLWHVLASRLSWAFIGIVWWNAVLMALAQAKIDGWIKWPP